MKNKDYVVFLDMDQCICNFNDSFFYYFQMHIKDYEKKFGRQKLEQDLNKLGKKFWENLEWMKDGKKLWNFCVSNFEKVFILSSPGNYDKSIEGKTAWLNREFDGCWLGIFDKDKYKYATPSSILVDDYEKNIKLWKRQNGIGILFKSTEQTIRELEDIVNKR